jgi:hypothetical protein
MLSKRKEKFLLDTVLEFWLKNLKGLEKLEGLSKETVVRTERKIFFQTLYWISILRAFGVVRGNSCPKRKKNFLSDIILDFYFKSLWGCQKKQLSEKKEKFSFRHLYWVSILRTLNGQPRWRDCQKRQPKN